MLVTFLNEDMYSELSLHFCEYTTSLDTDSARQGKSYVSVPTVEV